MPSQKRHFIRHLLSRPVSAVFSFEPLADSQEFFSSKTVDVPSFAVQSRLIDINPHGMSSLLLELLTSQPFFF